MIRVIRSSKDYANKQKGAGNRASKSANLRQLFHNQGMLVARRSCLEHDRGFYCLKVNPVTSTRMFARSSLSVIPSNLIWKVMALLFSNSG